eukprot:CAMPEP_0185850064 /NCGR_PEP_ID=MMETSP1354-20130828/4341_1 /TAXON_ID=708628 /ORGANISM="Erythrolobus madagascarensis, Strain CCMP3276" /LENGTH=284 /DNA_ID=CAMNT_0028550697 /DNA_START=327 /DNA_END=1182 /DNA_ORIENTATION=+
MADICAQKLAGTDKFSYKRVLKYGIYGLCIMGPFLYGWYGLMHRYAPGDSFLGAVSKALFEQLTLEPMCIVGYMIYDGVYTRKTKREVVHKIRAQFFGLWCKNALFWVPGNWANYYLGTPNLRVVFANMCSFWWNTYFSVAMAQIAAKSTPAASIPSAATVGNGVNSADSSNSKAPAPASAAGELSAGGSELLEEFPTPAPIPVPPYMGKTLTSPPAQPESSQHAAARVVSDAGEYSLSHDFAHARAAAVGDAALPARAESANGAPTKLENDGKSHEDMLQTRE